MKRLIVFTDLDETLLERSTYSFENAKPALSLLLKKGIPLVIVSSKTTAEIEHYRRKLENAHPFISENGGGIFAPEGYFPDYLQFHHEKENQYDVISLGTPYSELRKALVELRAEGFNARGFGDMTREEISSLTNLTASEAALATQRYFDEPFTCDGCSVEALADAIRSKGLNLTQGRLFHIIGENDKGKAVEFLKKLYMANFGDITTVAIGDSPTDIPMLRCVDLPVAVQKDDGSYDTRLEMPGLIKARGIGPSGWNSAVIEIIEKLGI